MSRKTENNGFVCRQCGYKVKAIANGSIRNHCPECLYSLHVDLLPGDRASACTGLMKAKAMKKHKKKGYQLVHQCTLCGHVQHNVVADDDNYNLLLLLTYE